MDLIPNHQILKFHPNTLVFIRKLYGLDQKQTVECVNLLQEWVLQQPHLIKKNFTREYLEKTIVSCKGSIEKAKKQIDKLCTLKTLLPKYFMKCDMSTDLADITKIAYLVPLPKMTKDHLRIFIIKINENEFTSASFMEYYRLNIVMCEYLKAHDYVNGFVIIDDYRNVNLAEILAKINLVELQQFITLLTEGYGARMVGIHILTESKIINLFKKTICQFLSPKISSRIHLHHRLENLHVIVDKDLLPIEYGGRERSVETLRDDWIAALSTNEHSEYLKDMLAARTDETCRLTEVFNEEYLGMPGSFRHLNVD